jgi:hypothetical protein
MRSDVSSPQRKSRWTGCLPLIPDIEFLQWLVATGKTPDPLRAEAAICLMADNKRGSVRTRRRSSI